MKVEILAVGRLKEGPERELVNRYLTRARDQGRGLAVTGFDVVEFAESRATRPHDRKIEEAHMIRQRLSDSVFVALDAKGQSINSEAMTKKIQVLRDNGSRSLSFVIGGADGLDPDFVKQAQSVIAFGAVTLPHQLARIILAEQLYRSMTLMSGHPYHRA